MSNEQDNQEVINRLEKFWQGYEETLQGEWSEGLSEESWKLLKDVKAKLLRFEENGRL